MKRRQSSKAMPITNLREQLIRDEREILHAYTDSRGFLTIGVGRLIDRRRGGGISHEESMFLLDNDIAFREKELDAALLWAQHLDPVRRGALLNMAFNLGVPGLLQFKKFLAALQAGDDAGAAQEMLQSDWQVQVGDRAHRLSLQVQTGEWV